MKTAITLLAGLCLAGAASADGSGTPVQITSNISTSQTWDASCQYELVGQIYVLPGATLTIPAGTVVASNDGGALAVTKGADINILGTADDPVIMTSTEDVATWTAGNPKTGTWRLSANEWGNLTIMGCAYISANRTKQAGNVASCAATNVWPMEGLVPDFVGDTKQLYGGGDDNDSSGEIHYLSIRYGGAITALPNKELNGLSLGGIGRGTDMDHIEIMNNVDDGIEIWGGTVSLKYFTVWNIGDDSLDVDQGWRGKAQFGLIVQGASLDATQGSGVGDNGFEFDGAEDSDQQPITTTTLYNMTFIGQPVDGDGATAWRDNARVQFRQCIFGWCGERIVRFDDSDGDCSAGYGAAGTLSWADTWTTPYTSTSPINACTSPSAIYTVQTSGNLAEITDSVFWANFAPDAYTEAIARGVVTTTTPGPTGSGNVIAAASPIRHIARGPQVTLGPAGNDKDIFFVEELDPRAANDALVSSGTAPNDGFFCPVNYRGAFSSTENWLLKWTAAAAYGFTGNVGTVSNVNPGPNPQTYTSGPLNIGGEYTYNVDNTVTGHSAAQVFWSAAGASIPLPQGDVLLIGLGPNILFKTPVTFGAMVGATIPAGSALAFDLCLLGFPVTSQAVHVFGVAPYRASNAQVTTIGAF